ncbi:MAG: Ty1/Copia family ribonuclease HI [Planctomycetaceae bacterium]|nr:Ty1/Copia family ribonuclease HI [Planctomycetaceae bacterium]
MRSHERVIIRIVRYLNNTKDKGIIFKPDPELGLECFVDADFAGGWCQADADNPENVMSRTGFVIRYAGCPIGWCSKLQTEIALSTAEAEYIALSQALREVIPLMTLLQELNEIFPLYISKPDFFCKVFEDNQSCIAMTESTKFTPRTKHIALKYHHFKSYVDSKRIRIEYIRSEDQLADIFTKPIMDGQFFVLRYKLCGW